MVENAMRTLFASSIISSGALVILDSRSRCLIMVSLFMIFAALFCDGDVGDEWIFSYIYIYIYKYFLLFFNNFVIFDYFIIILLLFNFDSFWLIFWKLWTYLQMLRKWLWSVKFCDQFLWTSLFHKNDLSKNKLLKICQWTKAFPLN